ncbi:MAG: ribosome small subunit-dependent GTPase A [Saprospiraceae bacterium]|nr:MAG: ribosome biogenesis GTPase RsgA [Bacteroidetes bacterium OLB9]MCO6462705.1 ribosome small subunit-dependent GTPase A [Saprospiraceae bacterium]MCZ2338573.1 ribosome small subunit-dependent GTPase A [Chitinophagales bacterium]
MKGIVIKSTGSWYKVKTEDGRIIQSRMVGKIKLDDLKLTNPIAVGDEVTLEIEDSEEIRGIIKAISPRKNYVVRQSPRKKHQLHFLASNVDQVLLIVTMRNPNLKIGFIDRFLMMTEPYSIPVIIVFNKFDIYTHSDRHNFDILKEIYTDIGYEVMAVSSVKKMGLEAIRTVLHNKITLVAGQSGVGKSTLINAIQPRLGLRTDEISDFTGKGQHTTTFAEMFELTNGGQIIDTPGIKTLSFTHLEVMDVAHNFKEIFEVSSECKFNNCTHRNEPHCAVKAAVEEGSISIFRYQNYQALVAEVEDQNYWERHTDV